MNYIILYACGIIIKSNIKKWKILISSIIGAVYTIVMYLNIIPVASNVLMKFLLSILMVYVPFYPQNVKKLCKNLVIFYLTSFVFGGCVFALMYIVKPQMAQIKSGVFVGTYPIKIAIVGGVVAFIVIQLGFKFAKTKLKKNNMIYELKIDLFENEIKIKGMLDTGNLLKEPITGVPVIIVEKAALVNLIPSVILENIDLIVGGDVASIEDQIQFQYISRFRVIPFSSVGKQNGLLLGIKCDSVNILIDGVYETIRNAILGIYDKSFTKNGGYSAIFGLDILEGSVVNENVSNVKV